MSEFISNRCYLFFIMKLSQRAEKVRPHTSQTTPQTEPNVLQMCSKVRSNLDHWLDSLNTTLTKDFCWQKYAARKYYFVRNNKCIYSRAIKLYILQSVPYPLQSCQLMSKTQVSWHFKRKINHSVYFLICYLPF